MGPVDPEGCGLGHDLRTCLASIAIFLSAAAGDRVQHRPNGETPDNQHQTADPNHTPGCPGSVEGLGLVEAVVVVDVFRFEFHACPASRLGQQGHEVFVTVSLANPVNNDLIDKSRRWHGNVVVMGGFEA